MEKIRIRKMTNRDIDDVYGLGLKHWGKGEDWLTKSYLKSSFEQKGISLVAEINGEIVGGIIMVFEDIVRNWIRYLIIDKKARKKGIGRMFIEKLAGSLKKGESIFVDTGLSDKGAVAFYEKVGFKNRGKIKSLYENSSGYVLEKNIS